MSDYSLDSKSLLLKEINDRFGTYLSSADIIVLNLTVLTTGPYNTRVTLAATEEGDYRDSVPMEYNRTPLNKIFTAPVVYTTAAGISNTTDLLARLKTQYNLGLTVDDIISETIVPTPLTSTIGIFTLKANINSIGYTGSVDIYFSSDAALREWVKTPYYQYESDGKSLYVSGSSIVNDETLVIGKKGTFTPTTLTTSLALGTDGIFTLGTPNKNTKLRFRQAQLVEVVGPGGESSYGIDGKLLNKVPRLPPIFDPLLGDFTYTGTGTMDWMSFASTFNVDDLLMASGVTYYVDVVNGSDTAVGSNAAPLKSLAVALDKTPLASNIVLLATGEYFCNREITGRNLTISSVNGPAVINGVLTTSAWAPYLDSDNTFQFMGNGLAVAGVVDWNSTDVYGGPTYLKLVASIDQVPNTPGSYYVSPTAIVVNTTTGTKPDAQIQVIGANTGIRVTGSAKVLLKNITASRTAVGIVAESKDASAIPTLYLSNVKSIYTLTTYNLASYGAKVFSQNSTFTDGLSGGSYYGPDRQTIPQGVKSTFIEKNCNVNLQYRAGAGLSRGSVAATGTVGIRIDGTVSQINGYGIQDYGLGTATANFELNLNNPLSTDKKAGAYICSGKVSDTSGAYGRSMVLLLSVGTVDRANSGYSLVTEGSGELFLYNTPVGPTGYDAVTNPYQFIYTSSVLA